MSNEAYVLFALTITDDVVHQEYLARALDSFSGTGAELVFASADLDTLEGTTPSERLVLLKFPTEAAARDWYHSEAYAHARPLRSASADTAFAAIIRTDTPGDD